MVRIKIKGIWVGKYLITHERWIEQAEIDYGDE